ncbi:MAG TPA: ChaN family lipoprotein [Gemmatimonadaceae bacterium]|nr:ChaN family lipoprotein [Gemmatimonadaceae bacterium]
MKSLTAFAALAAASLASACTGSWSGSSDPLPRPTAQTSTATLPTPPSYRVVETATGLTVPFSALVGRAAQADVVYFGEQHDDPETHFLEFALLEGLGRRHSKVVLSLEMFERDTQYDLDRYLAGSLSEGDFLATSRPWPRYATDYRSMVQLARARGWKVIAANVPRPMASAVARRGLSALDTLTALERTRAAAAMSCGPEGAYFRRFAETMSGGMHGPGAPPATDTAATRAALIRVYEAQCVKDETMAESIARELTSTRRGEGVVLHVNGAFHSDYGQGTAERVRRRTPDIRSLLVTAVPVEDPANASLGNHGAKADYVIFTRAVVKKPGG